MHFSESTQVFGRYSQIGSDGFLVHPAYDFGPVFLECKVSFLGSAVVHIHVLILLIE